MDSDLSGIVLAGSMVSFCIQRGTNKAMDKRVAFTAYLAVAETTDKSLNDPVAYSIF